MNNWNLIVLNAFIQNYVIYRNLMFLSSHCLQLELQAQTKEAHGSHQCNRSVFPTFSPHLHSIASVSESFFCGETLALRTRQEEKKSYLNRKEPPFQVVNKSLVLSSSRVNQSKQQHESSHFVAAQEPLGYSKNLTGCQRVWGKQQTPRGGLECFT